MKKTYYFMILGASTMCSIFTVSSLLMAQSAPQSELRQMVWTAAQEIESGNIASAKQILQEVSNAEELPTDVQILIDKLEVSIEASVLSRQEASLEQVLPAVESSMSHDELQKYIDELTNAVDVLFNFKN